MDLRMPGVSTRERPLRTGEGQVDTCSLGRREELIKPTQT